MERALIWFLWASGFGLGALFGMAIMAWINIAAAECFTPDRLTVVDGGW